MQHCTLSYLLKFSYYTILHEPANKRNKHIEINLQEVASLVVLMCIYSPINSLKYKMYPKTK